MSNHLQDYLGHRQPEGAQPETNLRYYRVEPGFNSVVGGDMEPIAPGADIEYRGGIQGGEHFPPASDVDLITEVEVPSKVAVSKDDRAPARVAVFRNNNWEENGHPATLVGIVTVTPSGNRALEGRYSPEDGSGGQLRSGTVGNKLMNALGYAVEPSWAAGVPENALTFSVDPDKFGVTIGNPATAETPLNITYAEKTSLESSADQVATGGVTVLGETVLGSVEAGIASADDPEPLPLASKDQPLMTRGLMNRITNAAGSVELSTNFEVGDVRAATDYISLAAATFERLPLDKVELLRDEAGELMTSMALYGARLIGGLHGVSAQRLSSEYAHDDPERIGGFIDAHTKIIESYRTLQFNNTPGINGAPLERARDNLERLSDPALLVKKLLEQVGDIAQNYASDAVGKSRIPATQIAQAVDVISNRALAEKAPGHKDDIFSPPKTHQNLDQEQVQALNSAFVAAERIASIAAANSGTS